MCLSSQRQGDCCKSEASLGYTVSTYLKQNKTTNQAETEKGNGKEEEEGGGEREREKSSRTRQETKDTKT